MNFTYGLDHSSPYHLDPPKPVEKEYIPFYSMKPSLKLTYYGLGILTSAMAIIVCAGQLFTKTQCTTYKKSSDESKARMFEIMAGITITVAVVMLGFSIYAMVTKMGLGSMDRGAVGSIGSSDLVNYDLSILKSPK
jgi:hypothetical protein